MTLTSHLEQDTTRSTRNRRRASTLAELMVTIAIVGSVLAGLGSFLLLAGRTVSGVTTQTTYDDLAGQTSEKIFSRVRFATSVSTDPAGNTLTLGFDDDYATDSDGDANPGNDRDHFEVFQFLNGDGKDSTTKDNSLIYKPRSTDPACRASGTAAPIARSRPGCG